MQTSNNNIPDIARGTAVATFLFAVSLVFYAAVSNGRDYLPDGGLLPAIIGIFEIILVFFLLWPLVLGIGLVACAMVPRIRAYCQANAWILLAALLAPFYFVYHILNLSPVLDVY